MSPQYKLMSELLALLRANEASGVMQLIQIESLIYRLKLLLLVSEQDGGAERDRICPVGLLDSFRRRAMAVDGADDTQGMILQLEAELRQLVGRMEEAFPQAARGREPESMAAFLKGVATGPRHLDGAGGSSR